MSTSAPFSELGVRQLQQVFSDFKEADDRAKKSVDSTKRVILHVAKHYASSRSTVASAIEQIRQIDGHLRYFVNHFERSHARAVAQLARFGRDIGEGPISREVYQPFNEYLILRTTASIRGLKLLRVLESALRIMWQSTDARNILIPAFGEHPAQRVGTILQDLNEYLRAVQATHIIRPLLLCRRGVPVCSTVRCTSHDRHDARRQLHHRWIRLRVHMHPLHAVVRSAAGISFRGVYC